MKIYIILFFVLFQFESFAQKCSDFKDNALILRCCNSILEIETDNFECNLFKGNFYLNEQLNPTLALGFLNAAIATKPDSISTYYARSEANYLLDNFEQSLEDIKIIKRKQETNEGLSPILLSRSGYVNLALGNYNDAFEDFLFANKYLTHAGFDDTPNFILGMANAKEGLGQNEVALELFSKAIKIDSTGESLGGRAQFYLNRNKIQLAIADFEYALKKDNPTFRVMFNYALLLNKEGQTSKSIELQKKCIANYPKEYNPYESLGFFYFSRGELNEAKYYFKTGIENFPTISSLEFGYGIACYNNNEKKEGCLHIKKASELGHGEANQMYSKYCK